MLSTSLVYLRYPHLVEEGTQIRAEGANLSAELLHLLEHGQPYHEDPIIFKFKMDELLDRIHMHLRRADWHQRHVAERSRNLFPGVCVMC